VKQEDDVTAGKIVTTVIALVLVAIWFISVAHVRDNRRDACIARGGTPVVQSLASRTAWDVPCLNPVTP
jgi:hypothetical protein